MNPRCPPTLAITEVVVDEVDLIELTKDPRENSSVEDKGAISKRLKDASLVF